MHSSSRSKENSLSHRHLYSRQNIDQDDIDAVVNVMQSDYLTQGPMTEQFESVIATYTGARHAIAVNSATSALHLSMLADGIGENDLVWTTPNTFVATANSARMCGAKVRFIDINPRTLNLCPEKLETALKVAAQKNELPKVIVFVHFGGNPTGFNDVAHIAESFGISLIEDGSHALGSSISGVPIGACSRSKATIFSLHAVKPITAGEGGVVTTNDDQFAERLRLLRSHGVTRNPERFKNANPKNILPRCYYEQLDLGFNYRMSDIHAALGHSQTKKIDTFANYRRELSELYEKQFDKTDFEVQFHEPEVKSARHLFVIKFPTSQTRDQVTQRFVEAQIGFNFHYIPVYRHPYYKGSFDQSCTHMEDYYDRGLTLPLHTFLDATDVRHIAEIVKT